MQTFRWIALICVLWLPPLEAGTRLLNETWEISPADGDRFHWPYLLLLPYATQKVTLLVMPNNSGTADDDWNVHAADARIAMAGDGSRLAQQLGGPVLIPMFPRPKSDRTLYTHALNRRALEIQDKPLARLDLQLIAMIEDASKRLAAKNLTVDPKVFLLGFSASAMFVNRFTMLHPERVKKVAFGSPGGWPLAPLAVWEGKTLNYPVGLADMDKLSGKGFDAKAFQAVPQFYFLGAQDLNDSVLFRDSFSKQDEDLIRDLFGNTVQERWDVSQQIYRKAGCNCTFRQYPGIGHEMNRAVWRDVVDFFNN